MTLSSDRNEIELKLNEGTIKGFEYKSLNPKLPNFKVFKAVPYAKPPVGRLRWSPPEPIGQFSSDQIPTDRHRAMCHTDFEDAGVSPDRYREMVDNGLIDEDCLTVNIFMPSKESTQKRPIVLWFHGGGFSNGAHYPGFGNTDLDIIFVTVQYRLGLFGFMSTWDEDVEKNVIGGNYGLLDQQQALSFIQANAENLGGDVDRITIIGEIFLF